MVTSSLSLTGTLDHADLERRAKERENLNELLQPENQRRAPTADVARRHVAQHGASLPGP